MVIFELRATFSSNSLFFSLLAGNLAARRPVLRDCAHHQEVGASECDFLRHRIARYSRDLREQGAVCDGHLAVCPPLALGRSGESLAAKLRFPNPPWLGLARQGGLLPTLVGDRRPGRNGRTPPTRIARSQACLLGDSLEARQPIWRAVKTPFGNLTIPSER